MRVIIKSKKRKDYWDLIASVEEEASWQRLSPREAEYLFERRLKENNIPNEPYESEVCEMVHVDYDKFTCVLLHEDGSYTQADLSEVKRIMEQNESHDKRD